MSAPLILSNLAISKENTYYTVILIFSILVWLLLLLTIVGILYALLIGIFLWFGHGLLIASLKSDGVEVTECQLPKLHAVWREVCQDLQLAELPRLYVVQAGGALNAFATRFSGRNFVVLYSDMVEAYGEDSHEVRFVLGHEVGHLKRNHLLKKLFVLPGLLLPLIGAAYSRACESSCDRFGAFAARDLNGAVAAMMRLAGGKEVGQRMSGSDFGAQYGRERGFFVSWYELISGYPTLSHRVADLLAIRDSQAPARANRHPLAYLFALMSLGGRAGGGANLLVTIAVIAVLAGIALPVMQKTRERAQAIEAAQEEAALSEDEETPAASEPEPANQP